MTGSEFQFTYTIPIYKVDVQAEFQFTPIKFQFTRRITFYITSTEIPIYKVEGQSEFKCIPIYKQNSPFTSTEIAIYKIFKFTRWNLNFQR